MDKSKPAPERFTPKYPSPMQAEMRGLSLKDIGGYLRSLFSRKNRVPS
jgi:hypothetical protein